MQNAAVLASIPSPTSGQFDLPGPLPAVHAYGLTLLVAIVAAVLMMRWRWRNEDGTKDTDLVLRAAVWGVAAGIVGARLYHVITSWSDVPDPKWKGVVQVWEGGLGVWGGILFGVLVGAWVFRRAGQSVLRAMDAVAPALLLAQAIGRLGNWWNQELYGKPTDLPWGLEIDDAHNQDFAPGTTFHPTFAYEALWNLVGVGVLLLVDRRWRIRPPALFSLYVAWYTFGRFLLEQLRVDPSRDVLGDAHERVGLARAVHRVVALLHLLAAVRREAAEAPVPARRPLRRSGPRWPSRAAAASRGGR